MKQDGFVLLQDTVYVMLYVMQYLLSDMVSSVSYMVYSVLFTLPRPI